MAGGEKAQPDMATILNQFTQTMTHSQSQIQHLQHVIRQLANGAEKKWGSHIGTHAIFEIPLLEMWIRKLK